MTNENLTNLEKDVLLNGIYENCYNDTSIESIEKSGGYNAERYGGSIVVWSNSVIDDCEITQAKQLSGVVSSLVKKGLVNCDGLSGEATISLTSEGFEVLKTLV